MTRSHSNALAGTIGRLKTKASEEIFLLGGFALKPEEFSKVSSESARHRDCRYYYDLRRSRHDYPRDLREASLR